MSSIAADADALFDAATAFIRIYQFRSRDQALSFGLTVAQAYTLDLLLSCRGTTQNAIAGALQLDKSTTSRIIKGMTRARLIDIERGEHDQREKFIVASREGRKRYTRMRAAIVRQNEQLLSEYSAAGRKAVIKALRQLAERASTRPSPAPR
ncbi:MAG: MarR family winged helix-turn-helix transcriptional regulator [Cyanobacteria bacterium]|nr:MarR family winged helix-turn-helix transcriptional regulator [Cyanobacteriota bacterium]